MRNFPNCRAEAVIDAEALTENFELLAARAKNANKAARPIAVVKANAYGHGTQIAVPAFCAAGCDFFAVATLDEALEVRKLAPSADILILGYTPPARAAELSAYALTQTVFSADYAAALSAAACAQIFIHIKVDGGMCRLGFSPEGTESILNMLSLPWLLPLGLYTHFPCADTDLAATRYALSRFLRCRATLAASGLHLFTHAAASAAALTMPEAVLDGTRPGLALYGISSVPTALPLRPAMTLTAPIVQIREVPVHTPVGYGGAFVTEKVTRIGVCPIGYADGLPRGAEPLPVTLLHQKNAFSIPIAGHICMDQTMIDLTDTPAAIGDRVVFLRDPRPLAAQLHTIPYEILTAISRRVERQKKGALS